jgi:ribonuclease G
MLIEEDPHQIRVAILEGEKLVEILIERRSRRGVLGNLYKGRVGRVLPGMQAAFVDIGLERDAFLYAGDIMEEIDEDEELQERKRDGETDATPDGLPSISDLVRPGQDLLVQVAKEPLPNKGARVTTQITLPGRHLVLLPQTTHRGISRRIEDPEERDRLRGILEQLPLESGGLIARTAAVEKTREELERDLSHLVDLWSGIRDRAGLVSGPTLIHRDLDLSVRVVRDLLDASFQSVRVEGQETFERLSTFLEATEPALADKLKHHTGDGNLLASFGAEEGISEALNSRVWLKSGGYLVIHPTEALVAIDVNTGRFVGRHNLEETVLQTNLEAVKEVVRQIRLRNLGGIIVVDLIDMVESEHRGQVFTALENELTKDRSKTKVLEISEFGLVQITRKRSRPSLERTLTEPCFYCEGRGRLRSRATVCLDLRRRVLDLMEPGPGAAILVRVHPEVARALQQEEGAVLEELEQRLGGRLLLQSDRELHVEQFELAEV